MILIADSGSTKTHWALMAANGDVTECITDGINPFFQTMEAMKNTISNQLLPKIGYLLWVGPVTDVFFYGAGCTPEKAPFVHDAVAALFRKAQVHVMSDMVGAARALFGKEEGVACILGTGSASCHWDGSGFKQSVPSLGFILGDEGSGAVLGKRLVSDLLKDQMTTELKEKFLEQYQTSMADIVENVYRKPFPNRYLANLARFAADNLDDPHIRSLVYDHFTQFVVRNIRQYPQHLPVGFVGGVAFHYEEVLREVLEDQHLLLTRILEDPIPGLIEYHRPDARPTGEWVNI